MYRKTANQILLPDDFFLPFGGKLNKENRWVKLAAIIPWWEFEDRYAACFKPSKKGEPAYSVRIALGTLIIQARLGLSDRETVQQIMENPYLQYFLGMERFEDRKPPFDASIITHFRKRLTPEILLEINERIAKDAAAPRPRNINPRTMTTAPPKVPAAPLAVLERSLKPKNRKTVDNSSWMRPVPPAISLIPQTSGYSTKPGKSWKR